MDYFFVPATSLSPCHKSALKFEKRNIKDEVTTAPSKFHIENRKSTTPEMDTAEHIKKRKRRRGRHRKRGAENRNAPHKCDTNLDKTGELRSNNKVGVLVPYLVVKECSQNILVEIAAPVDDLAEMRKAIDTTKDLKNLDNSQKKNMQNEISPEKIEGFKESTDMKSLNVDKLEQISNKSNPKNRGEDKIEDSGIVGEHEFCSSAGQKRKSINKNRMTPKVDNNNRSWLDFSVEDSIEQEVVSVLKDEVVDTEVVNKCVSAIGSRENNNVQLDSYKNRFRNSEEVDVNNSVLNNEKEVKKEFSNKIGLGVNNFEKGTAREEKRSKKYDGTKRSRRKTEPFDFDAQADGQVEEVACSDAAARAPTWELPSSLCGFLTETETGSKRSLFADGAADEALRRIFDSDGDGGSDGDSDGDSDSEDGSASGGVLLPPEPQIGNVEYKLKLVNPTKQRFEHLVTQMKWRLREGRGEAVYGIGVRDCGRVRGLRAPRLRASLRTLRAMAGQLGAQCALLAVLPIAGSEPPRYGAEVLVRKVPDDQHNIEVRVAVMGSNDAGKSTLVGVLTQGELDNGRGSARLNMFRHLHEVRTGRTSSVSHEALGFDSQGRPINYAYSDLITPEEILEKSSKLVSFIDLAGHRKYLKTTVQGLTGYSPHLAMLVVSATAGVNRMTLEHLALVGALDLPFFVVITKTDCASHAAVEQRLRQELTAMGCRKVPLPVLTRDDVVLAASNISSRLAVPLFPVSSVTGAGLDALRWFLFLAPNAAASSEREQEPVEFQVDETFKVGDSSGPVVAGLLTKGVITERTKLLIGPLENGEFVPIRVDSLHRNKAPCRVVRAGQAASLGLSGQLRGLRQGMVLLAIPERYPHATDVTTTWTNRSVTLPKQIHYDDANLKRECKAANNRTRAATEQCQLSREKLLSDGAWNSEKVSPKACKKLRKRLANKTSIDFEDLTESSLRNHVKVDIEGSAQVADKNDKENKNYGQKLSKNAVKKSKIDGNLRLSFCGDEIERIINDIGCKNVMNIDTNLNTSDKITRLSPSRYASRFSRPVLQNDESTASVAHKQKWSKDPVGVELGLADSEGEDKFDEEEARNESSSGKDEDSDDALMEEDPNDPRGCYFFQASVAVLHNSTAIYPGFQATVHIGSIRQTAVIEGILSSRSVLRAGERASVLFRFLCHPEYVRRGSGLLLRQAMHAKGVGHVTQAFPHRG